MKAYVRLGIFVVGVIAAGMFIGITNPPGEWYASLDKPFFTPPGWLFAPVWTILYVLIAIAGWRVYERDPSGPAMRLWFGQMALNLAWTPAWFTLHWHWGAVAIIVVLLATIAGFIWLARAVDRLAALLFVPYFLWVAFATLLNVSIVVLNA